jgi:hypothetical protein
MACRLSQAPGTLSGQRPQPATATGSDNLTVCSSRFQRAASGSRTTPCKLQARRAPVYSISDAVSVVSWSQMTCKQNST